MQSSSNHAPNHQWRRATAVGTAVVLAHLAAGPSIAETVGVPGDWPTIQQAIDNCVDGDVIVIDDGTWTGVGNRNLNFGGRLITVTSASGNRDACIIDCQNASRAFVFNSGESSLAVVQSLTIRNGLALSNLGGAILCDSSHPRIVDCVFDHNQVTSGVAFTGGGGAVALDGSQASIEGCLFTENTANTGGHITGFGGAITVRNFANAVISDTVFEGNSVTNGGGAFHGFGGAISVGGNSQALFTSCTIRDSYAYMTGGAMYVGSSSDVKMVDCAFEGNTCYGSGGGLTVDGSSGGLAVEVDLVRCSFVDNDMQGTLSTQTGLGGGGIVNVGATLRAVNVVFTGNTAVAGGGISTTLSGSSHLTNALFHHNEAIDAGGVNSSFGGDTTVVNATIVANTASSSSGGMSAFASGSTIALRNTIVWGNSAPAAPGISALSGGTASVLYSNVQGGWGGAGNINADPLFVDAPGLDYRLSDGSPAIDEASNFMLPTDDHDLDEDGDTAERVPVDLDGNPRFVDDPGTPDSGGGTPPIADMGAYEYQPAPDDCPADTDGSGTVDVDDLVNVILDWGTDGSAHDADVDGSGLVDVDDLIFVITGWGFCP